MNPSPTPVPVAWNATYRDANGRFTPGNPGSPGNPYYPRQAELKRQLLACVSDADVQAVMQPLVGLVRSEG